MGKMNFAGIRIVFAFGLMTMVPFAGHAQTTMPDMLVRGTLKEQMDYVQEKTRIYEDFRAIREDMFQKIKNNALDSLKSAKTVISGLKNNTRMLNLTIDSLNISVGAISTDLDRMTKTKNSISLLGVEINKTAYNAFLWTIIAVLAGLLTVGFMAYKRNHKVTSNTRKEFEELKKEFEAYRKASREAREKMSMTHFNELKKLRGA
jgi:predicted Holliday junction resolvase-like endonuclease